LSSSPPSERDAPPGDVAALKRAMRSDAAARRDALDPGERSLHALSIARHVLAALPENGGAVAAYLPIRSEVDTALLIALLRADGRSVGVPAIRGKALEFRLVEDDALLEPQGFGTRAPGEGAARIEPTVILAPLLAFDAAGGRLGYGRGFYDRAIETARARGPVLVMGLAFDAQAVERVPFLAHDQPLDAVVTESGVRVPSAAASRSR